MKLMDDMKVGEMKEGKKYPISQGEHGYSDGVWMMKKGEEISVRHFFTKDVIKKDKEKFYYLEESEEVCYPKDETIDATEWIHKDIMQVIPEAITYHFEDMTLEEFYNVVVIGIVDLDMDSYHFPKHLKGKVRRYSRANELLNQI